MPRFEPFPAIRFTGDLTDLVAPPYDVLSEADVAEMQARSPHNIVHVDVPRGGEDRYQRAAAVLQTWLDQGILRREPDPSFTVYRMRFVDDQGTDRDIAGVLGALEVVDAGAGGVLPHERTTAKDSTDRLDLTRATRANLSPVWGLSLARGLSAVLAEPGEPLGRVVDAGVEHVVERIADPARVAAIAELVGSDDVLIADGHHRYGISRTYRDERRAAGDSDGPAELVLTFVNELVADQLSVAAIHRLYSGLDLDAVAETLGRFFVLAPEPTPTPATLAAMVAEGFLVLVGPERCWRLTARTDAFADIRALDGVWLETA
ncbi:MAG: hypothetical protein JWP61_2188, partial [Friedmanniella sp.]|nr:hypothetical protein [Friedmanniella sp.]